jgi:hypothetical protein
LRRKEHSSIILQNAAAAQQLVLRIPLKHLVGIAVSTGMAFGLRCLLQTASDSTSTFMIAIGWSLSGPLSSGV